MKTYFSIIILLFYTFSNAQTYRDNTDIEINQDNKDNNTLSWGYILGVNQFDFRITPKGSGVSPSGRNLIWTDISTGFSVNLIGKLRLNDYFDLRFEPGVHLVERNLIFDNTPRLLTDGSVNRDNVRNVKSTYIDMPFLINAHGKRWYNTRPYIQGGMGFITNLQSSESKRQDNSDEVFRLKTNNFTWQAEMGIDIYFKLFKLTPSVKGIFFINNEVVADNAGTSPQWAGSIESMRTRALVFSLKFE